MNADARREIIQEFVDQNHDVSFARIRDLFPNVSEMTIRRDLEHLSQSHKIIRVLGGARSVGSLLTTSEDAYTKRSLTHADGKKLIAQKARELVQPDSTIFLGSGIVLADFKSKGGQFLLQPIRHVPLCKTQGINGNQFFKLF